MKSVLGEFLRTYRFRRVLVVAGVLDEFYLDAVGVLDEEIAYFCSTNRDFGVFVRCIKLLMLAIILQKEYLYSMNIFPNFDDDIATRRAEIERSNVEKMLAQARAANVLAERQRQLEKDRTAAWLATAPLREHRDELAENFRQGLRESAAKLLRTGIKPHVKLITEQEIESRRIFSIVMSKTVRREALGWVLWDHSRNWFEGGGNPQDSNNGGAPSSSGYRRDLTILSETGEVASVVHRECRPLKLPFDTVFEPADRVTELNFDELFKVQPISIDTRLEDIPLVNNYYMRIIDVAAGLRTEKVEQ